MGIYSDILVGRAANAMQTLSATPRDRSAQIDFSWRVREASNWLADKELPSGPVGAAIRRFRGEG